MGDVTVKLFGSFRGRFPEDAVTVRLPDGASVRTLRAHLAESLGAPLDSCAIGDDTRILREDDLLDGAARVALLPPVCGG